jgi:uncharacterized hydrophobic protein (TIGR00341 family)
VRVIDLWVREGRLEGLRARVESCGHRIVVVREGPPAFVRVVTQNGDTDAFLAELREELRGGDADGDHAEHYVILEPVAVEPRCEEDEEDEPHAGSEEIETFVADGARVSRSFLVLSGLSGVLAAGGLLRDSVAVLVGAMVLAPLLKPIALAGVCVVLGRPRRAALGLLWLGVSLAIASIAGLVVSLLTPDRGVTDLLLSRTGISPFDLVIALAAGLAMAYTLVKRDSMSMVGIVVAASLMPVAAAVGVSGAVGRVDLVLGGVFTLASNICGIVLGLVVGLRIEELRAADWRRSAIADAWFKRSVLVGTVMASALIALGVWMYLQAAPSSVAGLNERESELARSPGVLGVVRTADGRLCVLAEGGAEIDLSGWSDSTPLPVIVHAAKPATALPTRGPSRGDGG